MSYTKQTWQPGEVITADKLNYIQNGIEMATDSIEYIQFYIDNNGDLIYEYEGEPVAKFRIEDGDLILYEIGHNVIIDLNE